MFGDSIVVQNMACCPHLCEVFQQNLNTSKQMFQKYYFSEMQYAQVWLYFCYKVKQIDMLNKEDNV